MKTADRENPNRWAAKLSNRANGAAGQNRTCSIQWAVKEEQFQPREAFFLLTFPFRELDLTGYPVN
jgi:hypothetical protein